VAIGEAFAIKIIKFNISFVAKTSLVKLMMMITLQKPFCTLRNDWDIERAGFSFGKV